MPAEPAPGFKTHPGYRVDIEKCPKRIRTSVAGIVIADSRDVLLVRESRHTPVYYFPREDVRMDEFLTRTDHVTHCPFKGDASYWTFSQGGEVLENLVWSYEDPFEECQPLKDYLSFYWGRMDTWFEDDDQVFVHARDPKVRIDITRSRVPLTLKKDGEIIAQSRDYLVLYETGLIPRYYLRPSDVVGGVLLPSDKQTRCPYKGSAGYHHARVGGTTHENMAWMYNAPLDEVKRIQGHVCFHQEHLDAIELGDLEIPTPDTFWADGLGAR